MNKIVPNINYTKEYLEEKSPITITLNKATAWTFPL
jgi:hypothetical protein